MHVRCAFCVTPARGRDVATRNTGSGETKEPEGNQGSRLTPQNKMHGVELGRRASGRQCCKREGGGALVNWLGHSSECDLFCKLTFLGFTVLICKAGIVRAPMSVCG